MKCDYKNEHPNTKIGEHHLHDKVCCKCGLNMCTGKKVSKKVLHELRKKVW